MAPPRSFDQRRADALATLSAPEADAWVSTASPDGTAHLVPLSIGWTGATIVLVTVAESPTARNLARMGRARVALGGTRDVVMIDAELVADRALGDTPDQLLDAFAAQSGWDPRAESDEDEFRSFELRPVRLQAWRESNEIAGRTLMRDGAWLDGQQD
jgi:Pyridoxamine 5'-phosphate oxidase